MKNLLNETVETIMAINENGTVSIERITREQELVFKTKINFKNYYGRMNHYFKMKTRKHAQKILLQRNKYYIGRYVPSYWED
jgi:hypothetical protein